MSRERAALLERLFQCAVDLPSDQREAYLAEHTAGDGPLLAEIRILLAEHERGTSGILSFVPSHEKSVKPAVDGDAVDDRYRLVRILGEGGLGIVWLAEQTKPLRRQVALKLIKPGMDSRQVLARFDAERQALALMDHAGIARVYDAGLTRDGRPYFVMEHVPGSSLVAYCDRALLTTNERLRLFLQVCDAVHHAHRKGIVHRDLKPSNILVAQVDDRPVAKVIDFGIAKAMTAPLTEQSFVTVEGQVIGTPAYMSPEQADGSAVDSTTDVYSLGVTLYQLLTGALPYDPIRPQVESSSGSGAHPRRDADGAVRPSSRVRALSAIGAAGAERAALRRTDPKRLARALRGDLDWIVMKAIDAEPERRYASASELGADIRRHLDGEPVRAGPPGLRREAVRFMRRHRLFVGVLAATFVALAIGIAFAVAAARRDAELREQAEQGRYRSNIVAAAAAVASGNASLARRALDDAPARFRGWEWRYLNWSCDRSLWTLRFDTLSEANLRVCAEGQRLVGIDAAGKLVVRDATSGEVLATCDTGLLEAFAIPSPDGRLAIVVGDEPAGERGSGSGAGVHAAWDLDANRELWRHAGRAVMPELCFARDGSEAALKSADGSRLYFFDPRSGVESRSVALSLARAPVYLGLTDGLAVITDDDGASCIDTATFATRWRRDERSLTQGHLDSGGRYVLFSGLRHQRGRILDARTGAILEAPSRFDNLYDARPGDAGRMIVLQNDAMALVLIDSATEQELIRLPGHTGTEIAAARFVGDGTKIASVSNAREFKMWSAETSDLPFRVVRGGFPRDVHAASGRCAHSSWGMLQVWDASAGTVSWSRMITRGGDVPAAAFSSSGAELAVDPGRGPLLRLDSADGRELARLADPPGDAICMEWMPDGSAVLVGTEDGGVYLCDTSVPQIARTLRCHSSAVRAMTVSGDGRLLATGSDVVRAVNSLGSEVKVWDARSGELVQSIVSRAATAREAGVTCLAFDPTGTRLAIGSRDGSCEVYDFEGRRISVSLRREHAVMAVRFMGPSRLAIGYPDARVHVHDAASGAFLLELAASGEAIDFDGERLVTSAFGSPVCVAETAVPDCGYHERAIAARARSVVEKLPRQILIASDVADAIARMDLPADVKQEAMRYAEKRGQNANDLNSEAWNIARKSAHAEGELSLALRLAVHADAICPNDWAILNTLAAVHLRLGRNEQAIETATLSNAGLSRSGRELHPVNFLILAIAHSRTGELEAARADLADARRLAASEPNASDRDVIAFLQEAAALVNP